MKTILIKIIGYEDKEQWKNFIQENNLEKIPVLKIINHFEPEIEDLFIAHLPLRR